MIGFLYLVSVLFVGAIAHELFIDKKFIINKFASSFLLGSLISVTICFVLLLILRNLSSALLVYFVLVILSSPFIYKRIRVSFTKNTIFTVAILAFSFLLFQKAFNYNTVENVFLIQTNLYQDMGAHIPFIRYFSDGGIFPEAPFFAGKNLFYHFMFDFYASILEYLGLRINIAFNLISALTLTSLFLTINSLSKFLFKNKYVGILACIMLLFNSDLSFIDLFRSYGISPGGLLSIYHHNAYPIGNIFNLQVSQNFLNINVYLNQRQLIFGLLWFFYLIYLFLYSNGKISLSLGLLIIFSICAFPFWNLPILISFYIVLVGIITLFKEYRKSGAALVILSLPFVGIQVLLIKLNSLNNIIFHPGFVLAEKLSLINFSLFWIWNLGIIIPLLIYAFIKSNIYQRKIFLVFVSIFIIANLFQFSRDPFDNHKFFNVWIVLANIYAGYSLLQIFKIGKWGRVAAVILFFLATLSGMLHFLVVKNDLYAKISDSSKFNIYGWIENNTKKEDIFLTNGEIYDPVGIMGRRIFLGRPQYVYLYGNDPSGRLRIKESVLKGEIKSEKKQLSYIIIYKDNKLPNIYKADTKKLGSLYKKVYEDNFGIIYKL